MSLSRLATVEVQLVMQGCDLHSLLAFARCSRHTLAAASSDFAFRCLSPLPFKSLTADLGDRIRASLLRHADTALRWSAPIGQVQGAAGEQVHAPIITPEVVAAVHHMPRLRQLDVCGQSGINEQTWRSLLDHPTMHGLAVLEVGRSAFTLSPALLSPQHLPSLRSLYLSNISHTNALMSALPTLSQLTSLQVLGGGSKAVHPLARMAILHVAKCVQLRRLVLGHVQGDIWGRVLDSPHLSHLTSLTLCHANAPHLRPEDDADERARVDWKACFLSLRSLRFLSLHCCAAANDILSQGAVHARELIQVRVRPLHLTTGKAAPDPAPPMHDAEAAGADHDMAPLPSSEVVLSLMHTLPRVRYILQLLPLEQYVASHRSEPAEEDWRRAHDEWSALASSADAQLASRIEVQLRPFGASPAEREPDVE